MKDLISSKDGKILAVILCMALLIGLVCCTGPKENPTNTITVTVRDGGLDVYKKASLDSTILGQLPAGLEIAIIEQQSTDETDWGRIEKTTLPDGTTVKAGWIDLSYVRFADEPEETQPPVEPTDPPAEQAPSVNVNMGTVTTGELNIRKGPEAGYESVGTYTKGTRIEILETKIVDGTRWGRTNLGWVGMGYVRMDGTEPEAKDDSESTAKIVSDGNYHVLGYGIVNLGELNVRQGPGTNHAKLSTVTMANRYAYYQIQDGWVRIEDGWVSSEYFYIEGTIADGAKTGSITIDDVNIRTGPNTSFQSIGTYKKGEIVEILAQVDAWGYTEKGWVFITYVEEVEPTYTTGTGKITIGLNIRTEPNADSEIAGSYTEGETVTITEVQGSWGKTDKGWINLKYVKFD